jgi:hypothetical protein
MKILGNVLTFIILISFSSCIVQAPKYTTVEKVLALKLGMSSEEVSAALGIPPYSFVLKNDSETVLLYKFRMTDRAVVPFFMKETNGKEVRGRFANLVVTYNKQLIAEKMASCNDCDRTILKEKRLDINKVITLLTVTVPLVLVYLGIKVGTQ